MSFFSKNSQKVAEPVESPAPDSKKDDVLSLAEFRSFMEFVNGQCRGIGCGYARRSCRADAMATWLERWAGNDRSRTRLLPRIRRGFTDYLPEYFRDYSRHDRTIENESAFVSLHERILASLS